jgi:hypothetical protein
VTLGFVPYRRHRRRSIGPLYPGELHRGRDADWGMVATFEIDGEQYVVFGDDAIAVRKILEPYVAAARRVPGHRASFRENTTGSGSSGKGS